MSEADKKHVDWTLIEIDYRAGIKTLEQIGSEYGVTKGRISQVAKKQGWTRDLKKKIQARTEAKLNEAAVNKELNKEKVRLAEKDVVEANSDIQVAIINRQRAGLTRLGELRDKLLTEVEQITDNRELFEQLGELMDESGEDASGRFKQDKRNELYRKVISMTDRIDSTKKLVEIDEKVRKGEREAFGLDSGDETGGKVEALLKRIGSE
jgi:hypothetical protein